MDPVSPCCQRHAKVGPCCTCTSSTSQHHRAAFFNVQRNRQFSSIPHSLRRVMLLLQGWITNAWLREDGEHSPAHRGRFLVLSLEAKRFGCFFHPLDTLSFCSVGVWLGADGLKHCEGVMTLLTSTRGTRMRCFVEKLVV